MFQREGDLNRGWSKGKKENKKSSEKGDVLSNVPAAVYSHNCSNIELSEHRAEMF